jgi:polar amino acid transport system substrate-binding protein
VQVLKNYLMAIKCGYKVWSMRHLSFSILLLALIFITAWGHADDVGIIPPDIARIKQRGELIVALYYDDVPPFYMHDTNNELVGIDIDIAKDIAEKLGVTLKLNRSAKTYDEVIQTIATQQADVGISALSDTLERAKSVRFTRPYWSLKQALLINRLKLSAYKNHPDFKKSELLLNQKGIRIGVIKGSSYIDFAKKLFPQADIISYDSLTQGVEETKKAKNIAFLYDEVEIMNWNKLHPEDSLFLKTDFITQSVDTLAIAVRWQDTHLLAWLDLFIEKSKDNFLKQLNTKYNQN